MVYNSTRNDCLKVVLFLSSNYFRTRFRTKRQTVYEMDMLLLDFFFNFRFVFSSSSFCCHTFGCIHAPLTITFIIQYHIGGCLKLLHMAHSQSLKRRALWRKSFSTLSNNHLNGKKLVVRNIYKAILSEIQFYGL